MVNLLLDAPGGGAKDIDFLWVSSAQPLKQPGIFLDLAARLPERKFVVICPLKQDRAFWEATCARAKVRAHYSAEAMTRAVAAVYLKYLGRPR